MVFQVDLAFATGFPPGRFQSTIHKNTRLEASVKNDYGSKHEKQEKDHWQGTFQADFAFLQIGDKGRQSFHYRRTDHCSSRTRRSGRFLYLSGLFHFFAQMLGTFCHKSDLSAPCRVHRLISEPVGFFVVFSSYMNNTEAFEFLSQHFGFKTERFELFVLDPVLAFYLLDHKLGVHARLDLRVTQFQCLAQTHYQSGIFGNIISGGAEKFVYTRDCDAIFAFVFDKRACPGWTGIAS